MSINFDSRVLITGGKGFLGRHVEKGLRDRGYKNVFTASGVRGGLDLGEEANVGWLFDYTHPDYVIHLACRSGGVGANFRYPGGLMYENLNMSLKIIEEARQYNVKKIVTTADIACYPASCPIPYVEHDFWNGYPHAVKCHYAIAKRTITDLLAAYKRQFGMESVTLICSDIYGPEDEFDPHAGKIIPAALTEARFAAENNTPQFVSRGNSKSTRDFIYVEDCARAVILALENNDIPDLINVGTGLETRIQDLILQICQDFEYEGKMLWEEAQSSGVERRFLDTSRAKKFLNFEAEITVKEGLQKTKEWYMNYLPSPSLHKSNDLPPSMQALR
jgi:GDP-L-fucose synthase